MKITFTGPQGTGKTTLIERLQKDKEIANRFVFRTNITREALGPSGKFNQSGDDDTQAAIMAQHVRNLIGNEDVIIERCALDGFVWTSYLYKLGKVTHSTLNLAEKIFHSLIDQYNIIFYTPAEFPLIGDNIRSGNVEYQKEIEDIFEDYIKTYRIPVMRLAGSVAKRIETVKQVIDIYDKEMNKENKFFNKLDNMLLKELFKINRENNSEYKQ